MGRWGAEFDPDRLADLELTMWKAYYRRQPARLFGSLLLGLREQAHVSWPRALAASFFLTRAAAGFARATGDYDRFARVVSNFLSHQSSGVSHQTRATPLTTDS